MSTVTQHAPGSFCWFELGTSDDVAARTFYSELLGWKERPMPMGDGAGVYRIMQLDGQDAAAMYRLMPEMVAQGIPPHWLPYVSVADIEATTARVTSLGGEVKMGPMDVQEHGRMAVVQDPQGAVFAVWQAGDHIGVGVLGEAGAQCWCELMTPDPAAAKRFYGGLFGWTAEDTPMGPMTYTVFKNQGVSTAGMMAITPEMKGVPPHWMTYFAVDDANDFVKRASQVGATVLVQPNDVPGVGRFAVLTDPQGAAFAILGPTK